MRKFLYIEPRKSTLNRVRFCFFCAAALRLVRIFFVIYQKTVENKLFHCYN